MTWVAWRTQRPQLLAVLGLAVLLALWLATTGLGMGYSPTWKYWTELDVYVLMALPPIIGLVVGAPLVAGELDRRTQRLAWTQGMSRRQWVGWKIVVGAATVVAASGLLTLLTQWWVTAVSISPLSNSGGFTGVKIQPNVFDVTGVVLIGYALFAFAVGAALGALIRRPGWAFAAGVPFVAVARLVVRSDLRAHLVAPAVVSNLSGALSNKLDHAWVLVGGIVPDGRTSPPPGSTWGTPYPGLTACVSASKDHSLTGWSHCLVANHLHYVIRYQPESHYWALQGLEGGIFIAASLVLLGVVVLAVRRIPA